MTRDKLTKQLELLHADLQKCDKRCKKISKECGLPDNELISWAMQETQKVLDYIESLKEKVNE